MANGKRAQESKSSEPPAYWVIGEVAEYTRLSDKSIYRLMRDDPTLPRVKIGGSFRFPRERLMRWLNARTVGK